MFTRKTLVIAGLLILGVLSSTLAYAGIIDAIALEDKGSVTIVEGHWTPPSYMKIILHYPDWGDRSGTYVRRNKERFVIDRIYTAHFWNIYPVQIHIYPQPIILTNYVTIPFFMATGDTPGMLGPLPSGSFLESASMFDGYGNEHPAVIESFFDVFTDLPLTGPHGEQYMWDRSMFAETQGNFYLAQVTMTADEFSFAPGTLTGEVELQDYTPVFPTAVAATIELLGTGTPPRTENVILGGPLPNGNYTYTISDVVPGTYNVAFKASQFLRKIVPATVNPDQTTTCDVTLTNGDVDGDNEVTSTDLSIVLWNMDQRGDW